MSDQWLVCMCVTVEFNAWLPYSQDLEVNNIPLRPERKKTLLLLAARHGHV